MNQFALKYLFTQTLERTLRLERILEQTRAEGGRAGARVVNTFRAHVKQLKIAVLKQLIHIRAAERGSFIAGWRAFVNLANCFNIFDELHLKLSYLPTAWTTNEIAMFITAVFDEAANRVGVQARVSVVPSDTYAFEEINLTSSVSAQQLPEELHADAPTLFLPKIEFDNPLHWCSLVHEFGHTLYEGGLQRDTESIRESFDVRSRWSEEVFCDILASKLLGPAYLASFTDFVVATAATEPIEAFSFTHPDARFRITAILEALSREGVRAEFGDGRDLAGFFYRLFEDRAAIEHIYLRADLPTIPHLDFSVKAFRSDVIDHIDSLLPEELRAASFESQQFGRLSNRLQQGIPIGSYNATDRAEAETVFAVSELTLRELLSHRERVSHEVDEVGRAVELELNTMRGLVRETACSVAEILNAGWMYKIEAIYLPLIETLDQYDDRVEGRFRDELFRLDGVLRVSIETAYLAKEFAGALGTGGVA